MLQRNHKTIRLILTLVFALSVFAAAAVLNTDHASAITDSAFQKSKVQNLTVQTVDTTRLKLTYDRCRGADGYEIYRAPKKDGKYKLIKVVSATKTTYKDTGRKPQTQYFYRVRALRVVRGREIYSKYSLKRGGTTDFAGNADEYDVSKVKTIPDSPLKDLNIVFLGSSITLGKGSSNQSFADYLGKRHGLSYVKLAQNGTTMATVRPDSYIERLERYVATGAAAPDYLVCQLGSNDSRFQVTLGTVDLMDGHVLTDLNTDTVSGAIEYISGYAQEVWNCPVIFFVMPQFESEEFHDKHYVKMISKLYDAKANSKWGGDQMSILNMWANVSLNSKLLKKWQLYMTDEIHPTKAGYLDIYTPEFEAFLQTAMANEIADAIAAEATGEELDKSMDIQLP